MEVKLWGVRGSLPRPTHPQDAEKLALKLLVDFSRQNLSAADYLAQQRPEAIGGFGGHTSCVEVRHRHTSLIVDAGSGLKDLGLSLLAGPAGQGQAELHILMTHFHWDHLLGLPFFVPMFIAGNHIHFYAVQPDLEKAVRLMFTKPYFPVDFKDLSAKVSFHKLIPRQMIRLGGIEVTPYQLDHPDPCWGYSFVAEGRKLAYCVDTEGRRTTAEELGADLPLYQKAHLMIYDAQYTLTEAVEKVNWGHAVASFGLDIALREHIDRILFVHHDPYASTEQILAAEEQTHKYHQLKIKEALAHHTQPHSVQWEFAREGCLVQV